eukprot:TRINITY_DN3416_c0_g1_i1.p1 TRINITY_DN3416_c0_g1~~TRINITY_DN3416_c0_g1_i1.p1  ORF type:complete len:2205 (-),score=427.39 TRINITY_DN3416_c0_g1_i1:774-6683(-)
MQVDVAVIKFSRKAHAQVNKQMPKVYKALDKIFPPITAALVALDRMLTPKLGYSPLLAVNAKINGWIYDPKIREIRVNHEQQLAPSPSQSPHAAKERAASADTTIVQKRDRGQAFVVSESAGFVSLPTGDGLEFDADRVHERVAAQTHGAGEMFEQFFHVEICLRHLAELHAKYTSVWVEWVYNGMVVDRSVIRDISTSTQWKGFGASFDNYTLQGEVRLPFRADTTVVKGGFFDVPIRLVLRGRHGLPIYANDGARRFMRGSPPTTIIGEICMSALRIGVGTDVDGITRSELRVPLHAMGCEQYRAAVLRASARITPVDSSSYSYRQMLSRLPNGEWTVRVNVFELRNLRGVDDSGSSDPFVCATVMGITKKTGRQRQTLSCMVNQLLFFSSVRTGLEFEDEKIVVEVMDWNRTGAPKKIGVYTVDAKRMLDLPGHEVYRKWFALQNPSGGKRPAGFIKMSITVVPPGGSPPHHDDIEDTEELSSGNLLKSSVLKTPKISYQNWAVHITVGWADMLPNMVGTSYRDTIRGYVAFNYSGWDDCKTKVFIAEAKDVIDPNIGTACRVYPQRRVIWNAEYVLPLTVINDRVAQEGISLKLYHKVMPRLQDPFRSDKLIGQVNVSFEELFKNMTTAVVRGDPADDEDDGDRVRTVALMKPRFYNFYGKPQGEADPYDKGVAFRGRVLIGVGAKPGDIAAPFVRPCPPPPRPTLQFYKLEFCVLRATELSLKDGWSVRLDGRIGLYHFGETMEKPTIQSMCVEWQERSAVFIPNMQFPEDVEQIPDLFITLSARKPSTVQDLEERLADKEETAAEQRGGDENDSEWQPKAFLRLPAKHLICGQTEPRWMFMDYPGNNVLDANDNSVPGSILMSTSLSRYDPTKNESQSAEHTPKVGAKQQNEHVSQPEVKESNEDEIRPVEEKKVAVSSPRVARRSGEEMYRMVPVPKTYTYSMPLGPQRSYTLRALIIQGRNLPAADDDGLSDPRFVVAMGDKRSAGSVLCRRTVSPLWEEAVEVTDVNMREGQRKPNVNVLLYDDDDDGETMEYLGRSIIPCAEMDTAEPSLQFAKWYPVFSVNPGVIVGEILADFQLIPTEVAIERPMPPPPSPIRSDSVLRISLVGLRDIKFLRYAVGKLWVECAISAVSLRREQSKRGAILQQRAYEGNCNILDVLVLDIQIPEDLRLAPALNIYVFADYDHSDTVDVVATACVPLEKWLSEHHRRLLTGETLIDDSFGTDAPVPERLYDSSRNYNFRRNAKRAGEEPIGTKSLRLHEVKYHESREKKNMLVMHENKNVLEVGFLKEDKQKSSTEEKNGTQKPGSSFADKISAALAPIRAVKYSIADTLADMMPDIAQALGIEVDEDVSLSSLLNVDDDKIDYDGTKHLKKMRGYCPVELESDFSEPAYGEFLLFRGDNRSLGNTIGRLQYTEHGQRNGAAFPPILPFDEVRSTKTLVSREKKRAALEGSRPAVGKVKARLDVVEVGKRDEDETRKVRLTSLRSFGRVFVPTEVVVRVYVLRGINLQQIGAQCNPYLTARFYGGYPDFYSHKHSPIMDNDNPNFFQYFESRVKMPGGSVRLEVKDRMLPEAVLPISYPMMTKTEEGKPRIGWVQQEVPLNIGKLGFGWSETIGETVIDLDARWYNSAWRSLARTPVETRSLYSEESVNLKGQLEMFIDIFDAKEVDKRPKMFRPVPISKPPQEIYEMRVVVYKIMDCVLPYRLAKNDPAKLCAFYVRARLGNRSDDEKRTDTCKYVADGVAEFNWRLKWSLKLPSLDVKPRLKLQIFDDTSLGLGSDQLCAVADIKLRSLFDEIVTTKQPIIKKKQWVNMEHPNHPDVQTRIQVSLELTTAEMAAKKKCFEGRGGYRDTQHEDYVLPVPFRPAAFSLYNPVPYFNYLIISSIQNLQWTLATVLLIFPFLPMFVQFVFMLTPWQWYAAGGVCGLLILIRISMVSAARTARMQAELEAATVVREEDENEE